MSVVLVCFPGAPKISEEAVKKEEELDKYLETRVEGQHTQHIYTYRHNKHGCSNLRLKSAVFKKKKKKHIYNIYLTIVGCVSMNNMSRADVLCLTLTTKFELFSGR